ncbi:MAG: TetR family transcriptional regulator [Phenylobacterium sp.]|nr:MAG: TetR family transcriptional regulator [Phenylobacterium sp.]
MPQDPSSPAASRQPLDRDAIVRAALDLLDRVGLDALSTRRLAEALGVSGPSLYWHFGSMGELRDQMAEVLIAGALPEPDAGDDWRGWLADGARGIRRAALSRRDGARLLAGARPTEARRALRLGPSLARLLAAGLPAERARYAFLALARYALGVALSEQASGAARSDAAFEYGLRALLAGIEFDLAEGSS